MSRGVQPAIDLSSDITQFFRGVVNEAMDAHGCDATDATETYLIALLADYAKPNHLNEETLSRPLTLLLNEAMQHSGKERFERLRSLGDGVLYVSGFFGDHLETRGIELDYVAALGARAYRSAGSMLTGGALNGPDVFGELAGKFRTFVDLFSEVANALYARSARSDEATLKVYERWLRTGSMSLADALTARGMMPVRGDRVLH